MEALVLFRHRLTTSDLGLNKGRHPLIPMFRIFAVYAVFVLVVSGCMNGGLPLERAYQFGEQIPEGMPRDEAVTILSEDAWYHVACEDRPGNDELFFYDNREWDRAEIVILRTKIEGGEIKVEGIYNFEPNAWHTAYGDCIDRSLFTDHEDSPLAEP